MDQIGDQRPKAYIREKMIGHVDAVIAVEQHEGTGDDKAAEISALASLLRHVREHGQREHHGRNGHIAAGPGFEAVIAAGEIRNHLPPIAKFTPRIIQRDQILIPRAGGKLF